MSEWWSAGDDSDGAEPPVLQGGSAPLGGTPPNPPADGVYQPLDLGVLGEPLAGVGTIESQRTGWNSPVLIEHARGANVAEDARMLLRRVCGAQGHPVGLLAMDPEGRAQAEIFKILERPAFPFRVFARRDEAWRWVRERRQLAALVMRP